ncbi:ABC transporter ATP-binding protein [Nakamurella leprariae]|uniref:ABC transporter ATP-binding protein n=1 Tax=Nakamurella leprariae TaxID=2803911 RepID=A0A938YCB2_9ACTN|nr:ABC transporter ATP-binding protein [Nakamurella leprariae]MBM9465862.1 ABC transporter ATP-binding protein [Nakamurella leprariae]
MSVALAEGNLLDVVDYRGGFRGPDGEVTEVLAGVSFGLRRSTLTAVVGETGSGKSLTALSVLGVQPRGFVRTGGRMLFDGEDLFAGGPRSFERVRGNRISLVFQDARAALNPVFTVGHQLIDVCRAHRRLGRKEAEQVVLDMLERVRIPDPLRRMRQYPHEFSGGMAQRVMLAMALVSEPELLVLDEPTTGLDVTIQADIMDLLVELISSSGLTACLITHDLGVVAQTCQDVVVMRSGTVREIATCEELFTAPRDEYTRDLLAASRLVEAR